MYARAYIKTPTLGRPGSQRRRLRGLGRLGTPAQDLSDGLALIAAGYGAVITSPGDLAAWNGSWQYDATNNNNYPYLGWIASISDAAQFTAQINSGNVLVRDSSGNFVVTGPGFKYNGPNGTGNYFRLASPAAPAVSASTVLATKPATTTTAPAGQATTASTGVSPTSPAATTTTAAAATATVDSQNLGPVDTSPNWLQSLVQGSFLQGTIALPIVGNVPTLYLVGGAAVAALVFFFSGESGGRHRF